MNFFGNSARIASPLVLAHRGARHAAVENTMSAFRLAQSEGADGTELDVVLSKDNQPTVFHDATLARMTDGLRTERISDLSSDQIAGIRLQANEAIPTLREVLDWAEQEQQLLNVELKTENARIDPIAEVVSDELHTRSRTSGWVLVSSFHPRLLQRFRVAEQRKPKHARVPYAFLFTQHHTKIVSSGMPERIGACAIHPQAELLCTGWSPPSALPFNTWTVNDASLARTASAAGARAIITDCPEKIRNALR